MTLAELVAEYLLQRETEGCRPASIRHYRSRLASLVASLGSRSLDSIQRSEVIAWVREATAGKAPDTIRSTSLAFCRLQAYGELVGAISAPICDPKLLPKPTGRRRSRLPTDAELRNILRIAADRWATLYRCLILTGARPSELIVGQIEQIETTPAGRTLILKDHKTSRKVAEPRLIPIGPQVAPWFDLAIEGRTSGVIFRDARGGAWTVPRVSKEFRRLRTQLDLSTDLVLYSARHKFGTEVVRKSGLFAAKALLGHSDVKTTQRYTHLGAEELRDAQQVEIDLDPAA